MFRDWDRLLVSWGRAPLHTIWMFLEYFQYIGAIWEPHKRRSCETSRVNSKEDPFFALNTFQSHHPWKFRWFLVVRPLLRYTFVFCFRPLIFCLFLWSFLKCRVTTQRMWIFLFEAVAQYAFSLIWLRILFPEIESISQIKVLHVFSYLWSLTRR